MQSHRVPNRLRKVPRRTLYVLAAFAVTFGALAVPCARAAVGRTTTPATYKAKRARANAAAAPSAAKAAAVKKKASARRKAKAAASAVPQAPAPTYTTGGLTFAPATVVDFQRTEGEPLNHVDKDGVIWETGPWGFSTGQSFIHRSTDGGNQFNVVSPVAVRPNPPPGGGDSDVITDDQGNVYFTDLEGLAEIECSVSNDRGNNWRKNPACFVGTALDRQWFTVDNGTNHTAGPLGAADNTVFVTTRQLPTTLSYVYSSPGSTGPTDAVGGLVFTPATTASQPLDATIGAPCGQMKFEPVHRNLYLPCVSGGRMTIGRAHVNVGQRTNLDFQILTVQSSSSVGNLFPVLAHDAAGNLYAVWANTANRNIYYAYSTDQGTTWSPAIQVNQSPANTNVFPWAFGGSNGRLAVAWYGTSTVSDPSNIPSWYANAPAAAAVKWFGYAALVTNAAGPAPTIDQNQFTHKPTHVGQVCLAGTFCATDPTSDRTMADYMAVTVDNEGRIRAIFNDTTSQHHGAHLFESRQIAGPSVAGTTINDPAPTNPAGDPNGDAQWPHYAPTGPGPNQPQLDFRQVKVSQSSPGKLQVQMTMDSLGSLAPPVGKLNAVWITRFQALSTGDRGEEAHRIFYVGAESVNGAPPTFFAGTGDASPQAGVQGDGCNSTTTCKVVQYPPETVVTTGKVVGNTICVNIPLSALGRPVAANATLYNVTAFSGGRNNSLDDLYADVDSTRSFDYQLGSVIERACDAINVALPVNGGSAVASSVYAGRSYSAAGAIDGDRKGANWEAGGGWNDGTRDVWPDSLEVNFNGGKALSEVRVYTVQNDFKNPVEPDASTPANLYGILDFDVQYWDGDSWELVPGGAVRGNDKAMRVVTFPELTTTKIRVFVLAGREHFSRIVEVEAFGTPAP